jgi:hypothetical protein
MIHVSIVTTDWWLRHMRWKEVVCNGSLVVGKTFKTLEEGVADYKQHAAMPNIRAYLALMHREDHITRKQTPECYTQMYKLSRAGIPYSVFIGTEGGNSNMDGLTYMNVVPQQYALLGNNVEEVLAAYFAA